MGMYYLMEEVIAMKKISIIGLGDVFKNVK